MGAMRIVALEEHFAAPALVRRIDPEAIVTHGFPPGFGAQLEPQLADLGALRLKEMDEAGITVHVLSASGPGADLLDGDAGVSFARDINDHLAKAIAAHPGRFAGFAHLPMRSPQAAADELERSVRDLGFCGALINGVTEGRFLDDARFDPILARAEQLDVPIYLHPNLPPPAVRDAYYAGLPGLSGFRLATASWGWHSEVAIHILRLVVSGTLDRHPKLKLIIGHMGEGLAAMLVRTDKTMADFANHLARPVAQTILEQVWVTTSGLFTQPPLDVALAVFGIDRVLFSIDYPYSSNRTGRNFLDTLKLSAPDLEKFAHGNADRLLKLSPTGVR
jgi:uncharacterized protein